MQLEVKTFTEILSRMIDLTLINSSELNDFTQSSVIYTIYQSIAMELELIGMLNRENILAGIETGVFEAFEFPRRKAKRAYGDVRIEFHSKLQRDIVIPQGTRFYSSRRGFNQTFEVLEDYIVNKGVSATEVRVYCTELGTYGNVPAGVINATGSNLFNVNKVTNPQDFLTGKDLESLDLVKRRFRAFIESRGRATNKALQYAVHSVEDISGVYVDEETGYIRVYAHDNNGNLDEDLKLRVENALENYRPSGIKLDVMPIKRKPIDLDITVILRDKSRQNELFRTAVEEHVRNHINHKQASEDLILMELISEVMSVDRFAVYDCDIENLDENIILTAEELMRAGEINITLEVKE